MWWMPSSFMTPFLRTRTVLAGREGLDLHAVVAFAHPELVGRAAAHLKAQRRLPGAQHAQRHVGDRAVHGVVLAPVRVRVDPPHEVLAGGRDLAAHAQLLPGEPELAAIGRLPNLGAAGALRPTQRVA